ncbi:MAG: hypothetical protein OEV42_15270 [Deltaproteobacteria bacterium]|nr:hypothetical protein [Deltaproteobacteria bacterium]
MTDKNEPGKIEQLFKAIKNIIPGFSGYQDRNYIIDSDILLRYNIALELEKFAITLEEIRKHLFLEGRLPAEGHIESTALRLKMMASSFRDRKYNDNMRVRMEKMSRTDIERLYEYDLSILDHIEGLNTSIEKLEALKGVPHEFKAELDYLNNTIDPIEEHRIKREEFLLQS